MKYIADGLLQAASYRLPARFREHVKENDVLSGLQSIKSAAERLKGVEIYAFDRSAMNAARDLRIDAPGRLEALVEAVLRSPRRLFLEADLFDVLGIGPEVRQALGQGDPSGVSSNSIQWGVFVEVLGEGRATFQVAYQFPHKWWRQTRHREEVEAALFPCPKALKDWAMAALDVRVLPETWEIDLSRKAGMSKSEFQAALGRIKNSGDPVFQYTSKAFEKSSGTRAQGRIVNAGWQATRFRELVRATSHAQGAGFLAGCPDEISNIYSHPTFSFALPIVAMLAVLQADSSDIRLSPRSTSRDRGKPDGGRKKTSRPSEQMRTLRVVTLNLEDRELQRVYEAGHSEVQISRQEKDVSGRLRHPVRGHLFLARNGKMTWRRPHWRGSLDQTTIRKVVAPSHAQ